MTIETYKVEVITGPLPGDWVVGQYGKVYFRLFRNGIKYDCSTIIEQDYDRSFSEWNAFIHDLLSSDTI